MLHQYNENKVSPLKRENTAQVSVEYNTSHECWSFIFIYNTHKRIIDSDITLDSICEKRDVNKWRMMFRVGIDLAVLFYRHKNTKNMSKLSNSPKDL